MKEKDSSMVAPAPSVTLETEDFWEATTEGKLLLKQCQRCELVFYYPRVFCPDCLENGTDWIEASGRGTIYSYSIIRQAAGSYADETPYVLAIVELKEGVRVMTNIIIDSEDELSIGQEVEVVFHPTEKEAALPRFRPI